jgi:predicted P-loop ATPase
VKAYFKLHDRDLKDLEACCTPGQAQSSGAAATPSTAPPPPPEPWRKALLCTQGGDPKECASNYALFLAHHPRLAGRLWWDAVRHRPMRDDLPLRDELITELGAWLGQEERVSVHALRLLERCAHAVAYRDQRDPLKEWLATLDPWDQIPNLSTWFPLVTGAPPTPYHQWLGQMLIVSMVARALDPGCIQRYVLILEGAEDTGKSALAQALAPDYYTTLSMALESKEAHIHIMGSWIVELTELDALSRTDESRIKAFITMRSDDYVPKFANSPVSYLRRSIFVGTTNEPQYLRGQTGNTRFFPVRTQVINLALFETLRLSLFAEALEFYHKHPQDWWVVPDAVKPELEIAREQRRIDTPFEELIGAWLPGQTAAEFTWKEIATGALGITEMERLKDKRLQMDVAAAMRRFGYERKTSKHGGPKAVKVWRT